MLQEKGRCKMKKEILIALCFFSLGMLTMTHEVCKQKDSTIRMLMKQQQAVADVVPRNLPAITIK